MPVLSSLTEPRTQKARGIRELMTNERLHRVIPNLRPPTVAQYYLIQIGDNEDLKRFERWWYDREQYWMKVGSAIKMFARPCPVKPAHGFVDSRVVKSFDEVMQVVRETEEEDTEGEVLVVPFIEANLNAVVVPQSGVITVGQGHDGATSGGEGVLNLFVVPDALTEIRDALESAGIEEDKHAFFEVVRDAESSHLVQVRSGAALPTSTDYIPRKVKVSEIVTISGQPSLLEYKKQIEELSGQDGVVVVLKDHGLASHYALHCIEKNVPVLCQPKTTPVIGDTLVQQDHKAEFNLGEYIIGYRIAERAEVRDGLAAAIAIMHNATKLVSSPVWSRLSGFAAAMVFKAAATACIGEYRYYHHHQNINRNDVYSAHRHMRLEWLNKKVIGTTAKFMHARRWEGDSSIGGRNWAMAATKAVKLFNRISEHDHEAAFSEANELLNYAHNGGWLFNKFIDKSIMDYAATNPALSMMNKIEKLLSLISLDPDSTQFPKKFWKGMRARKVRTGKKWRVDEAVVGTIPPNSKCGCLHHTERCGCFNGTDEHCDALCTRRYIHSPEQFAVKVDGFVWQTLHKDNEAHMEFFRDIAEEV